MGIVRPLHFLCQLIDFLFHLLFLHASHIRNFESAELMFFSIPISSIREMFFGQQYNITYRVDQ